MLIAYSILCIYLPDWCSVTHKAATKCPHCPVCIPLLHPVYCWSPLFLLGSVLCCSPCLKVSLMNYHFLCHTITVKVSIEAPWSSSAIFTWSCYLSCTYPTNNQFNIVHHYHHIHKQYENWVVFKIRILFLINLF